MAAQILSASVATALDFFRHLGVPVFADSEPTSQFIKAVDRAFDILNVRTPVSKNFKAPLTSNNLSVIKGTANSVIRFILSLEDGDGARIVDTRKSTGFIGFVICLKSLLDVSEYLLRDKSIKYVLSFKFSQDHLELLFNGIRRSCGWNNNPTSTQFKATYKRFLARAGVEPSNNKNCVDFSKDVDSPIEEGDVQIDLNPFLCNVTTYIAGFVVKKVLPRVDCSDCRCSLLSVDTFDLDPSDRFLLVLKNNGGLTVPSRSVVRLLQLTETIFREHIHDVKLNHFRIFSFVLRRFLSVTAFDDDHFRNSGHLYNLIQSLVLAYIDLRGRHVADIRNVRELSKRYRLNRQIIFESM